MKIISKPKLPNQTCKYCHTKVEILYKDLKYNSASLRKDIWRCPLCKAENDIIFDEKEN